MVGIEKQKDDSLVVTADDGAKTVIPFTNPAAQEAAVQVFIANHTPVILLPSDDPKIIAALQGANLAKILKWLINKRILTLDDLT